jgi:hypothetical protein
MVLPAATLDKAEKHRADGAWLDKRWEFALFAVLDQLQRMLLL